MSSYTCFFQSTTEKSQLLVSVGLCVVGVVCIWVTHWMYKWSHPRCNGTLPPGSMGFPFIGEALELNIPSNSFDVLPFIKKRLKKYGPIFRTSVAGRPVIVSADPDFNHRILQQEFKLVESWYLDLFGTVFKQGEARPDAAYVHKYTRNLALSHFGVESLREKLLPQLDEMVRETLSSWSNQGTIDVRNAAAAMAFEFAAKKLFSYDPKKLSLVSIRDKFINFPQAFLSFPLNIPGTAYHKTMKDQKAALSMLTDMVKERVRVSNAAELNQPRDLLDQMILDMNTNYTFLTVDFISQLIFGLVYASFTSLSWYIALAFKLLSENPLVLEALTAEQETLLKGRENPQSPITWEEYKSMGFTLQVINETLRMGVSLGFVRRARVDIQVKGYTIPAGWAILTANSALHYNPNTFKDPVIFNPSRWKDLGANVLSKNFMTFGSGLKQCVAAEYTRAFWSIFYHVLITEYRWTNMEGGDVVQNPVIGFKNGLLIKFLKKDK